MRAQRWGDTFTGSGDGCAPSLEVARTKIEHGRRRVVSGAARATDGWRAEVPENWMERLTGQMPVPSAGRDDLERRASVPGFSDEFSMPSDYLRFIATYGLGAVGDYLIVDRPALPPDGYLEEYESPYSSYIRGRGGVVYFGTTADADDVFYDLDPSAADGRLVVKRRHFGGADMWKGCDCGLLEFLVLVLEAQLPGGNPFSGTHIWGKGGSIEFTPWDRSN